MSNNRVPKSTIVKEAAELAGVPKSVVANVYDALLASWAQHAWDGDTVHVSPLVKLETVSRPARVYQDYLHGSGQVSIPAHNAIKTSPLKGAKDMRCFERDRNSRPSRSPLAEKLRERVVRRRAKS